MAQYFKDLRADQLGSFDYEIAEDTMLLDQTAKGSKGWGLHLGTSFPAASGTVTVGAYYVDAKLEEAFGAVDIDLTYAALSARYAYPLSKRTSLYGGAGYAYTKYEDKIADGDKRKEKGTQVYAGLVHTFCSIALE